MEELQQQLLSWIMMVRLKSYNSANYFNDFSIDVIVSLSAMISVTEGDDSVQVCPTLFSMDNTERNFIVTLGTSDGTGIT